jgi:hypothetical protein
MLRPSKKLLMRIGAVCILGAAGASAAVAADNTGALDSSASAFSAAATNAVSNVSLSAAAKGTADMVLNAIAGGTSPSAVASQRSGPESRSQAKQAKNESPGLISAAQRQGGAGTAGTVGVRPGWGCGDKNHTHSGPPGRPNADPPPGCER